MRMDPDKIDQIPENVTARLLPKTLFGEKYVSLEPPAVPSTARLAAGDEIGQDRSQTAMELEKALDDLMPVLQAVEPDKLSTTLGALSQGLEGRGEQLGQTLVSLNTLVEGISPSVPALQDDLRELATFSHNLADAAPDLLSALDDLTVPAGTIVDQADNLRDVYSSVTNASDDLRAFLDANGENIIALTGSVRPTLETLARYAPEFPCFFKKIESVIPLGAKVFGQGTDKPGVHITLEVTTSNRTKYVPGDEPVYGDDRGPRCYPNINPFPQYAPDGPFRDGSTPPPAEPRSRGQPRVVRGGHVRHLRRQRLVGPREGPGVGWPAVADPAGLARVVERRGHGATELSGGAADGVDADRGSAGPVGRFGARVEHVAGGTSLPRCGGEGGMSRIPLGPLTKFLVFAVVTALATTVLGLTIANAQTGERSAYSARFTDVTGLLPGDDVRVSGVVVGRVADIEVVDRNQAKVDFEVDSALRLPSNATRRCSTRT